MMTAFSGQLSAALINVSSSTDLASKTTALLLLSSLKTVGATATQFPIPVHKFLSTITLKGRLHNYCFHYLYMPHLNGVTPLQDVYCPQPILAKAAFAPP